MRSVLIEVCAGLSAALPDVEVGPVLFGVEGVVVDTSGISWDWSADRPVGYSGQLIIEVFGDNFPAAWELAEQCADWLHEGAPFSAKQEGEPLISDLRSGGLVQVRMTFQAGGQWR